MLLDLEKLRDQVEAVVKKTITDIDLIQEHKADARAITVLLIDIIMMQGVQASLTLAFLEKWVDDEAETGA